MTSGRCLLWIWLRPSDGDELALLCVIQRFVCLLCLHFNRGHPGESPCLSLFVSLGHRNTASAQKTFWQELLHVLSYHWFSVYSTGFLNSEITDTSHIVSSSADHCSLSLSLPWATAVYASHYCCFLGTAFPPSLEHSFHVWSERIKAMSRKNYSVSLQCVFCCPKLLSPTELVCFSPFVFCVLKRCFYKASPVILLHLQKNTLNLIYWAKLFSSCCNAKLKHS